MKRAFFVSIALLTAGWFAGYGTASAVESTAEACDIARSAWCLAPRVQKLIDPIASATVPKLATPDWLNPPAPVAPRVVTYSVATRGNIRADMDEFRSVVAATYADQRGWTRLGVSFQRVESGGQFTVYLSEASQVTSFSATVCDTTYSCNVGDAVIINQDRWLNASPAWTGAGGELAAYRQMVINHETGHWLGHGHRQCSGAGQSAPIMQQQSISLQGCEPNAWPLGGEMYSPKLGIRS